MFVALREMTRAKVRFGLLAVALGLLVFLILFQSALRDGLITQFIGALRNQSAPVLAYGDQARSNIEGSQITPEQLAAIAEVDGVAAVGRFGEGTFTVTTPASREDNAGDDQLLDAVIIGHELEGDAAGLGSPRELSAGREVAGPGEAVASSGNEDEGFEIGATVRVEPEGLEITIVGLADDVNYSVSPTLFVGWDTYEAARLIRNPDATAVFASLAAVQPAEGADLDVLTDAIDSSVAGVEALTRQEAVDNSPGVSSVRSSLDTVVNLLRFAVFLVVGLFMLIITVQKLGSLTLMKALGASTATLVRSLLFQAFVLVLLGSAIGIVFFSLIAQVSGGGGVGVRIDPAVIGASVGGIVVAALAATTFAALRIRKIEPADVTQTAGVLR